MKRVVVVYSGGRQWGGIETYLANLFRLYDRKRMQLSLISLGDWELTKELEHQGLSEDIRLLSSRRFRLRTILDIRRVVAETGAELIVSQGVVANAYARLAAMTTGVPNLTVVHSNINLDYSRPVTRWLYKMSDRLLRVGTARYVAVSGYLKDQVVRSGVDPDRVRVIYNGIDMAMGPRMGKMPPDSSAGCSDTEPPTQVGPPPQAPKEVLLVSVGRLHPVKNFDSLVRAMDLLPDNVRLTIWGEGHERSYLQGLVDGLGLKHRISLSGEFESMRDALKGTDVYLQPSKSEGFGLAVTEAMLHGKPVVVAPYGGLVEQVRDGVTGIIAKDGSPEGLAEAIKVLIDDPGLASRLGLAGKEAAERTCSIDVWLDSITDAFCDAPGKLA